MAERKARRYARLSLAIVYLAAGIFHLAHPAPFLKITPNWVPQPSLVIALTGLCEIAGAIALTQWWNPGLRKAAGGMLALYAVCVFPANINHMLMDSARPDHGLGWVYHAPRMVLQPVLVWLALWSAHVIQWPFGRDG
ncbi:MAG: hypothetical protein R3E04_06215 [Sphingobium sp.]